MPIGFVFPWVGQEAAILTTSSPALGTTFYFLGGKLHVFVCLFIYFLLGITFYCVLRDGPFGDPWSHRWSSSELSRLDSPRAGTQG